MKEDNFSHPRFSRNYFSHAFEMIMDYIEATLQGKNKSINLLLPERLKQEIDFTIGEEPMSQ